MRALDESQIVDARRTEAETDCMLIDHGVISSIEARNRVANQFESAYHGLNMDEKPDYDPDSDIESDTPVSGNRYDVSKKIASHDKGDE